MQRTLLSGFSAALLFLTGTSAQAAVIETSHARVELLSEKEAAAPGEKQWLGISFKPKDGWHVYWSNPGDSGLPPRGEFSSVPAGSTFGPIEFPTPERIPYGPLVNYAYHGDVLYPVRWEMPDDLKPGENITLTANLKWLICKEECVPGKATLSLTLPVETKEKFITTVGTNSKLFKEAIASLPAPSDGKVRVSVSHEKIELLYSGQVNKGERSSVFFFPEGDYGIPANAKQMVEVTKEGTRITIPRTESATRLLHELRGVLKIKENRGFLISEQLSATPVKSALATRTSPVNPSGGLALMLLFAFIGGIILNLMPCILPVLSIKVLSIAVQGGEKKKEIRNHGLVFTLGVMVSFWILASILLAVRAGGNTLGWGFQLQSPVFIAALAVLFFLMALNLFGFFEISSRFMGSGSRLANKEGYTGSFFTGVLTTVAATPCSAPFMGTALGFALGQPGWIAILVLSVLGLGLSFPYLVFSFLPSASRLLPRPGAWMKTLKEVLAFPLLATVVWLVGVLGNQVGSEGMVSFLAVLVLITAVIWLFGRKSERVIPLFAKWSLIAIFTAIASTTLAGFSAMRKHHMEERRITVSDLVREPWKAWSPTALEEALAAKKTVLVNITADWCVTCKLNETVVFERPAIMALLRQERVVALLADWTSGDPVITSYMAKHGRNSIPVYLLYVNGSREPKILPQILSAADLAKDLK